MPCEYASFFLKPANFFDVNPGITLPAIRDAASMQVRPLVPSSILKPDLGLQTLRRFITSTFYCGVAVHLTMRNKEVGVVLATTVLTFCPVTFAGFLLSLPFTAAQVGCCGSEDGGLTKSEEVHHKQHQVQKHDCCGRAGDSGCVCAPGCECVRHRARATAPASRL